MAMLLALFHACSVWFDEAIDLSVSFSVKCLLCFMFCWGYMWERFISSWVQLQWKCPIWQIEELIYMHLSLKAGALAVTSDIPPFAGRTGGKWWFRAAGCADSKIIWKNRAVSLSWLINMVLTEPHGFAPRRTRMAQSGAAPVYKWAAYHLVRIFLWKELTHLCDMLFSPYFRALLFFLKM